MTLTLINSIAALPVLAEVDLLVISGGLAGLPVVRRFAQAGHSVLLIEQGTFLGYEICDWQRPWLHWQSQRANLAQEWLGLETVETLLDGSVAPLHPDRLKRRLEDQLLTANPDQPPQILYNTLPVDCQRLEQGWQVVLGNKSGRQVVRCQVILDASETQLIARLGCPVHWLETAQPASNVARRTLEFTRVVQGWEPRLEVPAGLGVHGNRVDLYPGPYDAGHVLVDIPILLADPTRSLAADTLAEYHARRVSLEAGSYLIHHVAQFSRARLGWGSLRIMHCATFDPLERLELGEGLAQSLLAGAYGDNPCLVLGPQPPSSEDHPSQSPEPGAEPARPLPASPDPAIAKSSRLSDGSRLEYRQQTQFNLFHRFPETPVETTGLPLAARAEVLVIGGGTSGAAAAYTAARAGARTLLVEMNSSLGGTATLGGVSYYWFGHRNGFTHTIDRQVWNWMRRLSYPRQDYVWGKKDAWSHELKAFALLEMISEVGAQVFLNCLTIGALVGPDNAVQGALIATPYGPQVVMGQVTVDATGDGDVAAFAGADFVYGNERDRMAMWGALAWYRAPGVYQGGNFGTTVDMGDILDITRFILVERRRGSPALYDHASYLAPRESRHIQGEITLTLQDQILLREFPDTISLCFSNHDPKGRSTADLVYFGILPPHLEIPIPYRALVPRKLENLLVTGKALSCTHDALAAIRMIDDLQKQGAAAGVAAARCVQTGLSPRQLDVHSLQESLVEADMLSPAFLHPPRNISMPDYAALVAGLTGTEPLEWLEMGVKERLVEPSPVVLLCTAPARQVLPWLRAAFEQTGPGARRLLLARLLLWHGDESGLEDVLTEIYRQLDEDPPLPRRKASIRWCQLYPDHGVMTEVTYLVNLLSRARSPRVVACLEELVRRIEQAGRDYTDMRQCMFNYLESVAYVSERLAMPELIPLLTRLLTLPELNGRLHRSGLEADLVDERLAYLVICLSRALARCGSRDGLCRLAEFTADCRVSLARSARDELLTLTGMDYGSQAPEWSAALRLWPETFPTMPWTARIE